MIIIHRGSGIAVTCYGHCVCCRDVLSLEDDQVQLLKGALKLNCALKIRKVDL